MVGLQTMVLFIYFTFKSKTSASKLRVKTCFDLFISSFTLITQKYFDLICLPMNGF